MSPAEKIIIKKVIENLNRSLSWSGNTTDWAGYANQMKNSIRDSKGFLEGLLEIPEKSQQKQQLDQKSLTVDDLLG